MKVCAIYLFLLLVWKFRIGHTAKKQKKKDPYSYLMRYGYINSMSDLVSHAFAADSAIRKFQRYAQLPVTGKMNPATVRKLTGPRCGAQDFRRISSVGARAVQGVPVQGIPVASFRDMRRKKRYVQQGTKWLKQSLTWSIHSYPSRYVRLSRGDVDRTLEKAFKMWQSVAQLNFQKLNNNNANADIRILFGRGNHGDPYWFDGQGGTLAHGFYPGSNTGLAGDVHFDNDETWSLNGHQGTVDLLWTSIHEIGHAIGLEHSEKKDAIMWPWFEGFQSGVKLRQDDISGIQSIYGARSSITCPASNEQKPTRSSICNYGNFDDVLYHKATCTTYFFRGAYIWRMDNTKYASNHERISSKWRGLTGYIDAAYTRSDGSVLFFKSNRYWIYDKNFRKIEGPSQLSQFIKNSRTTGLDRIDAAMVWDGNSRVYFFRKDKYWRYNTEKKQIDIGYPKKLSIWRGLKSPVDGAFSWKNSKSFFLRGKNVEKFNNDRFAVHKGRGINKFIRNCK